MKKKPHDEPPPKVWCDHCFVRLGEREVPVQVGKKVYHERCASIRRRMNEQMRLGTLYRP